MTVPSESAVPLVPSRLCRPRTVCWAAVLALLACAPRVVGRGDALWNAALSLDSAEGRAQSGPLLEAAGRDGLAVLLRVAHIGGEQRAVANAMRSAGCSGAMVLHGVAGRRAGESALAEQAAFFASRLLQSHSDLLQAAVSSRDPFDRAMAVASTVSDAKRLLEVLGTLQNDPERVVAETAVTALRCPAIIAQRVHVTTDSALGSVEVKFADRVLEHQKASRCTDPATAPALAAGLIDGSLLARDTVISNNVLTLQLRRHGTELVSVSPGCAIALYDLLARRARYEVDLLTLFLSERAVPKTVRDQAAERLQRDLRHYPEDARNWTAARLTNAGYAAPIDVAIDGPRRGTQEDVLQAAARQGSSEAVREILKHNFCRTGVDLRVVALLGFVGTKDAADLAARHAERCPESIEAATAALVRLGDPRGLPLLKLAMERPGVARVDLESALFERFSPRLEAELQRIAENEQGSLSDRARTLLRQLERDGIREVPGAWK